MERIEAVELFLADVSGKFRYASQLNASDPAAAIILRLRRHMETVLPSFRKRIWLASMDLTCDTAGQLWFVDDHYCCPYGLYRMQQLMNEVPSDLAAFADWRSFLNAGRQLVSNDDRDSAVVLGSATFNTVYSENRFFAEWLGLPYVSQRHLQVTRDGLKRVTGGSAVPVNLVLRRLQDEDLDPNYFQVKSLQGVRGIVRAHSRGLVSIPNAPGTGVFNNRSVSKLIPDLIRFYLGREPCLPTIRTENCDSRYSLESGDLQNLVFRTGNSMDLLKPLVGHTSTDQSRGRYFSLIAKDPERFVVRRTVAGLTDNRQTADFSLRVFCVGMAERTVLRGGLKRACYSDGTPKGPVTQDETVVPFAVDPAS